jgi:hypothetical protein
MAKRILLASEYCESMMSAWTDEIYCTRRQNGTFSLRERKFGSDGSHWFPGITAIQTARQFIDAYYALEYVEIDVWDFQSAILPKMFELDPFFALSIERELRLEELDEEFDERIDELISPVLKNADIQYPDGITKSRLHSSAVREYIVTYMRKFGTPPAGRHFVGGFFIVFTDGIENLDV